MRAGIKMNDNEREWNDKILSKLEAARDMLASELKFTQDQLELFKKANHETALERDKLKEKLERTKDHMLRRIQENEEVEQKVYNEIAEENDKLKVRLAILRRYHGGDGSITREQVIEVLGTEE